jgi:hypothetical protein
MSNTEPHKKQSLGFLLWIPLVLLTIYFFLPIVLTGSPPSLIRNWMERRTQRQQVLERIQSAGGWVALKRDCDVLANKHKDASTSFSWSDSDTSTLPPAIAALKPKYVEFYPRKVVQSFVGDSKKWFGTDVVVRISIFGAHSTGGHDQPWLGLDVLCDPDVASYHPERLRSIIPLRYWKYRKVAEDIYEFY